jgi:hypothetical protein
MKEILNQDQEKLAQEIKRLEKELFIHPPSDHVEPEDFDYESRESLIQRRDHLLSQGPPSQGDMKEIVEKILKFDRLAYLKSQIK